MLKALLLLFSAAIIGPMAHAENIFKLERDDLLAPFTAQNRPALFAGTGVTLTLLLVEDKVSDLAQVEVQENKRLKKLVAFGDLAGRLVPNGLYILALGGSELFFQNATGGKSAMHMFRATTSVMLATILLKETIREPRPNDSNERNSFPSGHSAAAFSFASVVGLEYGPYWGTAAFALASIVAFSRMTDNRHELHDVVAGAALGISYGLSIGRRMRESVVDENMTFVSPTDRRDGFVVNWQHRFQ